MPQEVQQEIVQKLSDFAKLHEIKSIFIIGEYCRKHYLNQLSEINSIHVVSAYHEQAMQLGGLFISEVLDCTPTFYERTGTVSTEYNGIKIGFQGDSIHSYMKNEEVKTWMQQKNIEDIPLINNIYGRDFTINSLVYSLYNKSMYDPTKKAIHDFERKVIRSLLPSNLLIKYNPIAALEAVRLALKYEFFIDPDLRIAIKEFGTDNLLKAFTEERIVKEVVNILGINAEEGLKFLQKLELTRVLSFPDVKEYIYSGKKKNAKN